MPRLLHALMIAALLVTTSGVLTVASADGVAECTDGGSDDGCPDGAPWGCSSICTSCPCTSVTVPTAVLLAAVRAAETTLASVAPAQSHWPAPNLAGIFRPPRVA